MDENVEELLKEVKLKWLTWMKICINKELVRRLDEEESNPY